MNVLCPTGFVCVCLYGGLETMGDLESGWGGLGRGTGACVTDSVNLVV